MNTKQPILTEVLRKDMSKEVNAFIAEHVMGWKRYTEICSPKHIYHEGEYVGDYSKGEQEHTFIQDPDEGYRYYFCDKGHSNYRYVTGWADNPYLALNVVIRFTRKGYKLDISLSEESITVFVAHKDAKHNVVLSGVTIDDYNRDHLPMAICQAIKEAIEFEH